MKKDNTIFSKFTNTKQMLANIAVRALKTAAEAFLAGIPLLIMGEISFRPLCLMVLEMAVLSVAINIWGVPESKPDYSMSKITEDTDAGEVVERILKQGTQALTEAVTLTKEIKGVKISELVSLNEESEDEEDE